MVEVKRSPIHGRGLLAREAIAKGTVIGKLEGHRTQRNGAYVLWLNQQEGLRVTNSLRFVNHSNQPNAAYFDDCTLTALSNIRAGEEITHDYEGDGDID